MIVSDEITRDEKSHTYWKKDGYRVVGITELLAAMGYLGKGFFNDEALRRGKNVHLALHYYAKGTLNPSSLSPRIKPYFDSAMELITQKGAKISFSEAMVFDSISHVACQLDAVWTIKGEDIVVDYKSGPVSNWVRYQTAAHVNGLPVLKGPQSYRRWGLQLMNDGKPAKITEFTDHKDMTMVRMFASVFYTKVNDGMIPWPRTQKDFEQSRREENGIDLFGNIGHVTGDSQTIRVSEGSVGALSGVNGSQSTAAI